MRTERLSHSALQKEAEYVRYEGEEHLILRDTNGSTSGIAVLGGLKSI
jgi:hypothetical protein